MYQRLFLVLAMIEQHIICHSGWSLQMQERWVAGKNASLSALRRLVQQQHPDVNVGPLDRQCFLVVDLELSTSESDTADEGEGEQHANPVRF
jgi:hypothetical protein